MREEGATYGATGRPDSIVGALNVTAIGTDQGDELHVGGELESTTLAIAAPVQKGSFPLWLLGLGVLAAAAVVTTAVAAVVARRTRLSVDDFVDLANRAAEDGDYEGALRWTLRAKAHVVSARILTDEGFYRAQLGDVDAALAAYASASRSSADGEADFLAATLLATVGEPEEAAKHLAKAILLAPPLLFAAEDDPHLRPLLEDPLVRAAARRVPDEDDFREGVER